VVCRLVGLFGQSAPSGDSWDMTSTHNIKVESRLFRSAARRDCRADGSGKEYEIECLGSVSHTKSAGPREDGPIEAPVLTLRQTNRRVLARTTVSSVNQDA